MKEYENDARACFYAVSVGPGSEECLTLQAVRVLAECDTIISPEASRHVALDAIKKSVSLEGKTILHLDVPMKKDRNPAYSVYDDIAATCIAFLREGKRVAFISIGDVSLYSTAGHVAGRVEKAGFACVFVPGVSSVSAAACACAMSLADRDEDVRIIPGDAFYEAGRIREVLAESCTDVFMKSPCRLKAIIETVRDMGLIESSVLVRECTMMDEQVWRGRQLLEVPEEVYEHAYLCVLIVSKKRYKTLDR